MAKIQISIDDELLAELDRVADSRYMTRSGYVSQAVLNLNMQYSLTKSLQDLSVSMRRIADNNIIDEETKKELSQFEYLARSLTGK